MARVYQDTRSKRWAIDYTEPSGRRRRRVVRQRNLQAFIDSLQPENPAAF